MASLQDLHFAAALAIVKAQTFNSLQSYQDVDRQQIETLQDEVERLRLENKQLRGQIEAMNGIRSTNMSLDLPDSITINLKDPTIINTFKQVDVVRSYIERCRDRVVDSGTVFIDITCDVLSALTDSSIRQSTDDVAYAASWIGEGLDIAFGNNANPPEDCIARVSNALLSMISTFRKIDCFSEPLVSDTNIWMQDNNTIYADIREQIMHFLIQLGKRDMMDEFILSGLCSELLELLTDAAAALNTEDYIRHSQNASYVCRSIDCILQNQSKRCERNNLGVSDQLLKQSGLRKWVEIWPEILTASVVICDKLPLVMTFVWRLAAFIQGGCGIAWRTGLQELKNPLFR